MVGLIDTEGARAEWIFPAEAGVVRSARHAAHDMLRDWDIRPAVADLAVLLVSELVTNAFRYASGPIGVRLVLRDRTALLVEVSDPLPDAPTARPAGPEDEGGPRATARGLFRASLGHARRKDR